MPTCSTKCAASGASSPTLSGYFGEPLAGRCPLMDMSTFWHCGHFWNMSRLLAAGLCIRLTAAGRVIERSVSVMVHRQRPLAFALPLSRFGLFWRGVRRARLLLVVLVSALSLLVSSLAVDVARPGVAVAAAFDTPGIITTVAGGGTSGDGGPATDAALSYPWGIGVDAAGNLFIADSESRTVRRVSTSGISFAQNGLNPNSASPHCGLPSLR